MILQIENIDLSSPLGWRDERQWEVAAIIIIIIIIIIIVIIIIRRNCSLTLKGQITKVYINFFVQTLSPVENQTSHQNDTQFHFSFD